ncbi:MAG: ATP-binding protein [Firmicutes bacterium]|nr:ATP-binding protein [Bacillota bacterium]MCL1954011.1 ATP-binding protein [Bacillota bacterium]
MNLEYFDLNIEKVLEHWNVAFAIREFISNALDEQKLTNTKDIEIFKNGSNWYIRDFGRGIKVEHFSQNENPEKLKSSNLIGKFGVGLKDALAVLDRNNIKAKISSRYVSVQTQMIAKGNFGIQTLHAVVDKENVQKDFCGTLIEINVDDYTIEQAKSFFLHFNKNAILLECTKYGEIYLQQQVPAIYVNGIKIADEENFLFSYNITNINTALKRALNRERSNVGKVAYSNTIKQILLECKSQDVLSKLIKDLSNFVKGTQKDESKWIDVAEYATRVLNKTGKHVFVSALNPLDTNQMEIARNTGREVITLPDNLLQKARDNIYTFQNAKKEYSDSFVLEFIDYDQLTKEEQMVFDISKNIREFFIERNFKKLPEIKIVKKLSLLVMARGLWDGRLIYVQRNVLLDKLDFVTVVSHEYAHSLKNNHDNTREFENDLGDILGQYAIKALGII